MLNDYSDPDFAGEDSVREEYEADLRWERARRPPEPRISTGD